MAHDMTIYDEECCWQRAASSSSVDSSIRHTRQALKLMAVVARGYYIDKGDFLINVCIIAVR